MQTFVIVDDTIFTHQTYYFHLISLYLRFCCRSRRSRSGTYTYIYPVSKKTLKQQHKSGSARFLLPLKQLAALFANTRNLSTCGSPSLFDNNRRSNTDAQCKLPCKIKTTSSDFVFFYVQKMFRVFRSMMQKFKNISLCVT